MRFPYLAALGFFLVATPTLAQAQGDSSGRTPEKKIIVGSFTCRKRVPCLNDHAYFPSEEWAALGNSCISEAFGISNPNASIIDETAGIDGYGNLTTDVSAAPINPGPRLVPECFVVTKEENNCALRCNLVKSPN